MNSHAKPLMFTGAGLAATVAVLAATPVVQASRDLAVAPASSVSSPVALLSDSQSLSFGSAGGSGISPLGGIITNFLNNNQALVLGFAAKLPAFTLGPLTIGDALLAHAYYSGYGGSATGVPGVLAYLTSQLNAGTPADIIKNIVLNLTGKIPTLHIGPVQVGGSVLANAYFSGYNGSATGVPGLIAYVTSQLHIPTPAAGAATLASHSTRVALPAATAATAVTVAVSTPRSAASVTNPPAAKARAAASAPSAGAKAAASTRHGR